MNTGFTILHTEWSSGWGGQEKRIVAESVAFTERGCRVIIAGQPASRILPQAEKAGIPVVPFAQKNGLRPGAVFRAARVIQEHAVGLVHTHSSEDAWNFGLAARLLGVPVVRSRHIGAPIGRNPFSYFLYMKLADRVITSGNSIREMMVSRNWMRADRITSIPAGIDEKRFHPEVDPTPVVQEFGFAKDDFVIGIVAVLRSWKGHRYLIDAFHEILKNGLPAKLLIVGEGPQEKNLRASVREKGLEAAVHFAGYREDVPACMKAMGCLVLPSTAIEGTSQVLPQAMAMKVPVIGTTAGSMGEVITHGVSGWLVPPKDVPSLADRMAWIQGHPAEAKGMAERAYKHCLANFTFDRMIERTEQVYLEVLNRRKRTLSPEPA